jgi:hypothetical protein
MRLIPQSAIIETFLWLMLWLVYRKQESIYFNLADNPAVPVTTEAKAAKDGEFDAFVVQYTGLAKIMIALAAASISFGGIASNQLYVFRAKLWLASSIGAALAFCILVTLFCENYLHDVRSYGPVKCALTESLGLTAVICFTVGYIVWAWHLCRDCSLAVAKV